MATTVSRMVRRSKSRSFGKPPRTCSTSKTKPVASTKRAQVMVLTSSDCSSSCSAIGKVPHIRAVTSDRKNPYQCRSLLVFVISIQDQGRLVECGALLAQCEDVLRPVAARVEPGKTVREGRIAPAPRQPGAVVHHPQGAQGLDQHQLAGVEIVEHAVAFDQLGELAQLLVALAGKQHPQVLHRRPVHAVVEVDE